MALGSRPLSLLTFPRAFNAQTRTFSVRFLCLPRPGPVQPLAAGLPAFADASLVFSARFVRSLERLPRTVDSVEEGPLTLANPPDEKAALFAELASRFHIVGRTGLRPRPRFRKTLTPSYRDRIGDRQSSLLSDPGELECALHAAVSGPAPPAEPIPDTITWGRLLGFALGQPPLACALGLIGETEVAAPDDLDFFAEGGWLFIDLHASSDYAGDPARIARYASRIPPLAGSRPLFAPVLFPVDDTGGVVDEVFREAELYHDGLAKTVHGRQTTQGDAIELAWDDEQTVEWLTRQVRRDGSEPLHSDTPLGVSGYRVDVRRAGEDDWHSLVRLQSRGSIQLGAHDLGRYAGEGRVEVVPAEVAASRAGEFWLPSYFCTWRGSSLVLVDEDLRRLHQHPDVQESPASEYLLDRDQHFVPVDDKKVRLRYGETYQFRVRLVDLAGGGPAADAAQPDPADDSVATINFQRRKPPGRVRIGKHTKQEGSPGLPPRLTLERPVLGYPEALFAGANFAALEADLAARAAGVTQDPEGKTAREVGVPDPDVRAVEIAVEVRALDGDAALFLPLYRTSRAWTDDDPLEVAVQPVDSACLGDFNATQPTTGPLLIPRARGVRVVFTALGHDDPGYFAGPAARRGEATPFECRFDADAEPGLLRDPDRAPALRSFFFQPPPADGSQPEPAARLATELGLARDGLVLSGRSGTRTVLGCSAALRHVLSPDGHSIQLASGADLLGRWINVVEVALGRDWTWDGLAEAGITLTRRLRRPNQPDEVAVVGAITLPRALAPSARVGVDDDLRAGQRQSTRLIFFDAFDPKPAPGAFPTEVTAEYELAPALRGVVPEAIPGKSIRLPITTPPVQIPVLRSAGIALSPYQAANDYSATAERSRRLWLELAEPPADPEDAYFVRVLAAAPDPMLIGDALVDSNAIPEAPEPPLPIEPEWVRLITPGQPRDESGLSAMQRPTETADARGRFLVPLPEGLTATGAELFGFFVYEIRVGHTDARWSTAQARFGPPLRVTGVQHPPPPLACTPARTERHIVVRAPFATPIHDGRLLRPRQLCTRLWAMLYARVQQADAASWRNVLIARKPILPPDPLTAELVASPVLLGEGRFAVDEVNAGLALFGLPPTTPLTTLAAELFAQPVEEDPLGIGLGNARLLRVSPLVPVPDPC